MTFVTIFVDWRLKMAMMAVATLMYLTVLLIPFWVASSVRKEVKWEVACCKTFTR